MAPNNVIVHFDRLKPCPKRSEFVTLKSTANRKNSRTTKLINPVDIRSRPDQFVAGSIENDEDGEADVTMIRRYPQRVRHAPARYNDYVPLS